MHYFAHFESPEKIIFLAQEIASLQDWQILWTVKCICSQNFFLPENPLFFYKNGVHLKSEGALHSKTLKPSHVQPHNDFNRSMR